MNQYMIEIQLPEELDQELLSMIPEQREHIETLMNDGLITSYSLAEDRSKLWVVLDASNEQKVLEILSGFPIIGYVSSEVHPLAFNNNMKVALPRISLN